MKVYFFTKEDSNIASSRQRAFRVAETLSKDEKMSVVVCTPAIDAISATPWPAKAALIFSAWKNLARVGPHDVLFVQRAIGNKYFFVALMFLHIVFNRKLVFDYDDAIFTHSPRKTKFIVRHADAICAGSHALVEWASRYNNRVFFIPTLVDHDLYAHYAKPPPHPFTIGWAGNGPAHYENLKLLVPVFRQLVQKGIPFRFVLVGCLQSQKVRALFETIPGLAFECIDALEWGDPSAMPRALRQFSVGVMPLVDSEWNRGKCAFKAIEYMAAGIPAIVSPVGENTTLIADGENGLIASGTDEWVAKICNLYNDQALCARLGAAGQSHILDHYSFAAYRARYRSILENV